MMVPQHHLVGEDDNASTALSHMRHTRRPPFSVLLKKNSATQALPSHKARTHPRRPLGLSSVCYPKTCSAIYVKNPQQLWAFPATPTPKGRRKHGSPSIRKPEGWGRRWSLSCLVEPRSIRGTGRLAIYRSIGTPVRGVKVPS